MQCRVTRDVFQLCALEIKTLDGRETVCRIELAVRPTLAHRHVVPERFDDHSRWEGEIHCQRGSQREWGTSELCCFFSETLHLLNYVLGDSVEGGGMC